MQVWYRDAPMLAGWWCGVVFAGLVSLTSCTLLINTIV